MSNFENLNRPQIRRDRLCDLGERGLRLLTWVAVIGGGIYLLTLFAQTLDHLQRNW
jgi:hypothetical protein